MIVARSLFPLSLSLSLWIFRMEGRIDRDRRCIDLPGNSVGTWPCPPPPPPPPFSHVRLILLTDDLRPCYRRIYRVNYCRRTGQIDGENRLPRNLFRSDWISRGVCRFEYITTLDSMIEFISLLLINSSKKVILL